jgi:hypothetical protein
LFVYSINQNKSVSEKNEACFIKEVIKYALKEKEDKFSSLKMAVIPK